ncbi:MAG: M15 family metallopeptidase [Candidatus Saccharibacteria bacterium]
MGGVVRDNPQRPAPAAILAQIVTIEVFYWSFDGQKRSAMLEINRAVESDVRSFFTVAWGLNFPIDKVICAADTPYFWDDGLMMAANATSGFNYRKIADSDVVSEHGFGRAIDINTRLNPYIRYKDGARLVAPAGAEWDPRVPGTLCGDHPLVIHMEALGWSWGGNWAPETRGAIDYQHFEKPAAN